MQNEWSMPLNCFLDLCKILSPSDRKSLFLRALYRIVDKFDDKLIANKFFGGGCHYRKSISQQYSVVDK